MAENHEGGNTVHTTAADWVIRLGGVPLTSSEQQHLDNWLAASPEHRAAFDEARSTWAQLDLLKSDPGPLRADLTTARSQQSTPAIPILSGRRWRPAGTLFAGLLVAAGFGIFWFGNPVTMLRSDHRTAIGEIRSIALDDGSKVELGPATAIAIRFDGRERRVKLLSGVASFTPTPRSAAGDRPFVVEAANGESRALGTRFIVDRLPDAVRVTVAQHDVDVSARTANGDTVHASLSPGRQVRYDAHGLGPVAGVEPERAEAWRQGRLLFDGTPLADVVSELNRYRRGQIVIASPALASRRVSGVFDAHDVDGAVSAIASELGAVTVDIGPFATILH